MPKLVEGFADKVRVPPGARDVQVFDDDLPGFGIRKFPKGHASYFVKYNVGTQQRRKTLGKVVRGNLKAMRLEASAVLAKARLGTDVVALAKAAASKSTVSLGEIVPKYLSARQGELRPKSHFEATRYLERSWSPLHNLPVDAITRQNVVSVVDDLARTSGKVAADRARMALSGLFGWAIDRGFLDSNPSLNVRSRAQNGARKRVLSEAELVDVWRACGSAGEFGAIVRLLLLTGQRRAEIGDVAWHEIDFERRQIDLPAERTKNNRAHIVPLSNEALAILHNIPKRIGRGLVFGRGVSGFSGWSKAKAQLDRHIANERTASKPMPPWTLHDIRRSVVTALNERGFAQPHIIEALVNHISGSKAGVAGVYNRAAYIAERRAAIERWGAYIMCAAEAVNATCSAALPAPLQSTLQIDV